MANIINANSLEDTKGINMNDLDDSIDAIKEDTQEEVIVSDNVVLNEEREIPDEYYENAIADIAEMNFVEVSKFEHDMKNQLQQLEYAKQTAESILEMQKGIQSTLDHTPDLTNAIDIANSEVDAGIEDIEKFLNNYEDTKNKIEKLIEKAGEKLHEFDEVDKTTSYLTNAMVDIINKNISNLEVQRDKGKNVNNLLKYYKSIQQIYSNRSDITIIMNKMDAQKQIIKRMYRDLKKDKTGRLLTSVQSNVTSVLCTVFSVMQLEAFEKYIMDLFNDETASFYFQYALYLAFNDEKKFGKLGKHKAVELLIMNVLDITLDSYDLDGGKEDYDAKLLLLKDKITEILK